MEKTYHGSCHCGAVKFRARIDLSKGTSKCNCSVCVKTRNWSVIIKPDAFELLSGENDLSDYQFSSKSFHHLFCKHCGVRPFGRGNLDAPGGEYIAPKVYCLDDLDPQELIDAPVMYCDGLHNNWWESPAEVRHL